MAKIPFDIKYRPQIESGEYKVETRSGLPVRIVCWDRNTKDMEILALVYDEHIDEDNEDLAEVALNGRIFPRGKDHDYDLFIITPEEELTEFEAVLMEFVNAREPKNPMTSEGAKNNGSILLNIAREQFIKDGYIIEKKAFREATEKVDLEMMKEVSEALKELPTDEEIKSLLRTEYEKGRADVLKEIEQDPESSYDFKRGVEYGKKEILKDLPRWREWGGIWGDSYGLPIALVRDDRGFRLASVIGVGVKEFIMLDDLKKLPGFKED